jgi:hypothetical protein
MVLLRDRSRPSKKRVMFDTNAFSEPPFSLFTLALVVCMAGPYILRFYIQTFAVQTKITDTNLGSYSLVILNAASMFGRVVPISLPIARG